jgi:hypothetical protein
MIHSSFFPWLLDREDPQDARDRMHRIALREARIATERRTTVAGTTRPVAVVRRAALAPAGTRSDADVAACCA